MTNTPHHSREPLDPAAALTQLREHPTQCSALEDFARFGTHPSLEVRVEYAYRVRKPLTVQAHIIHDGTDAERNALARSRFTDPTLVILLGSHPSPVTRAAALENALVPDELLEVAVFDPDPFCALLASTKLADRT